MEPRRINFADPEYEPTDEDHQALLSEAFADVRDARERRLRIVRAQVAAAREDVRRRLPELKRAAEARAQATGRSGASGTEGTGTGARS